MRCSCYKYPKLSRIHEAGCDFYSAPCPNCQQTMVRGRALVPDAGMISVWLCDCNDDDISRLGGEYSKIRDYLRRIRSGEQTVMMGLSLGELSGTKPAQ